MSIDLSLDRLRQLVDYLPPYTRPTLHIAGTNGKGSVSALLTTILLSSDPPLRVGRYNSPHLVTIYDCITLDGVPVSEFLYRATRLEIEDANRKHGTNLSSFELLTLTALGIFEKEKVDIVVLEVGMGGRLDATNIVPDASIAVSALTAVDLDHQKFLGETVRLIAREKAGIGRKGRPFVLGRQRHADVEEEVRTVAASVGFPLVKAVDVRTRDWDETIDGPKPRPFSLEYTNASITTFQKPPPQLISTTLPCFTESILAKLPLHGSHQLDNVAIALTVVSELLTSPLLATLRSSLQLERRITPRAVTLGINYVRWPGRLSFHPIHISVPCSTNTVSTLPPELKQKNIPLVVLADGAHNPASAETLGAYITHLLDLALHSASTSSTTAKVNIDVTYVLALSHSPPKTPLQTLSSILPPILHSSSTNRDVVVSTSVALLRFTPPDGMPWVKSVPPSELASVVHDLVPAANLWVGQDRVEGSDTLSQSDSPFPVPGENMNPDLLSALKWAAERQDHSSRSLEAGSVGLGIVVLAGSLYLVADFYRFLDNEKLAGNLFLSVVGAGDGRR